MDWKNLGERLHGAGEGFAGRGAQWRYNQLREKEMEQERTMADARRRQELSQAEKEQAKRMFAVGSYKAMELARSGDINGSRAVLEELKVPLSLVGTPMEVGQLESLMAAEPQGFQRGIEMLGGMAEKSGLIEAGSSAKPHTSIQYNDSGAFGYNPNTQRVEQIPTPENVNFGEQDGGMTEYQREQVRLRAAQLDFDRAKELESRGKLSPPLQEYQLAEDRTYESALGAAQSADGIADSYEQYVTTSGAGAKFEEFIKQTFGTEDAVTQFRTEYAKIRNSLVMGDLPPGVASDKDIELAMSGYPSATANPEYVASFMRGMAKLNRYKAARALYNKNYLSTNRTIEKKDRYWKAPIKVGSGDNTYETNLAEIYYSAIEAGMTVEQMLKEAGVESADILKVIGY